MCYDAGDVPSSLWNLLTGPQVRLKIRSLKRWSTNRCWVWSDSGSCQTGSEKERPWRPYSDRYAKTVREFCWLTMKFPYSRPLHFQIVLVCMEHGDDQNHVRAFRGGSSAWEKWRKKEIFVWRGESPTKKFCLKQKNNVRGGFSGSIEILCIFWRGVEGF